MIKEHIVKGNKSTTFHNFVFGQADMNLTISAGTYWNQNTELFTAESGAIITIEIPTEDTHYEIWLNDQGIVVLSRTDSAEFGEVINPVDRLAWFTGPAGAASLDAMEINVVKMKEVAA